VATSPLPPEKRQNPSRHDNRRRANRAIRSAARDIGKK
jgi:hypothetical protein